VKFEHVDGPDIANIRLWEAGVGQKLIILENSLDPKYLNSTNQILFFIKSIQKLQISSCLFTASQIRNFILRISE